MLFAGIDSKSVGGDPVWVRPPSPAPIVPKWFLPLRYFLFGRFLFFGEFSKIDFAGNHVRGFHLAVHVDVGVNIGRSGKTGMPQPHLYLFHCDFILD